MKVLFVHQNFPAQFIHLAADLAEDPTHQVVALGQHANVVPDGVELRRYALLRAPAEETHALLREEEEKVLRGEAVAAAAAALKHCGFYPDVILAHPGWGEALFLKDVFPEARMIVYCEYFYAATGQDVGFDPELPPLAFDQRCRLRLRNASNLLALAAADAGMAPTQWQRDTYPSELRSKIRVIHDGVCIDDLSVRNPRLELARPGELPVVLTRETEVLTFVSRHLELTRGFHCFMRMLPQVLQARPSAHALVIGADGKGYGPHHPDGGWKKQLLAEVGGELDLDRVHFLGQVPRSVYANALALSRAHLYWTVPFVLSWSFLEAAAAGVPVVASATAPVLEFADEFGVETVDFFDLDGFAAATIRRLAQARPARRPRRTASAFSTAHCVQQQRALISSVLEARGPLHGQIK
jgi:glycosyltransferase involved in cell wall biosynthesis